MSGLAKTFFNGRIERRPAFIGPMLTVMVSMLIGPSAWAQTVYTWTGSTSSEFTNSANWSEGSVPPTNNAPTIINARISVSSGNYPLIYTSDQGHTLYAASGGNTYGRSLFISSGGMIIQGGTFESQATSPDGIANGGTGSLTINGGEYRNVNGSGAKTFLVVFGANGTGTLTIQSGTFAVHTLQFGESSTQTGTGRIYLNGGTLSVGTILDTGNVTSSVYLNGGTLQARASTEYFLNNLNNVYIQAGGALIDTQGHTINIPLSLQHDPALGTIPDGGLRKTGSGTLKLSAANTYTGSTQVNAGVLQVQHAQALGTTDSGTTVADGARLELAGGITVSGESITISGSGGNNMGALQSVSGSNTWAGPVLLGANDARIGANGSGQTLVISGVIDDGPNSYNLVVRNADGGGETILTGQNTYGGATRVFVGTLKIAGGDNRLPTASPLQVGNGSNVASALVDLNGYNQQVAGLVSEGSTMSMTVTNSSAIPSTLTINTSSDRTYSGVISGNLALVKQGAAMQTLSGSSANTYTGTTTVNQGQLYLAKASGVVAVSGDLVISGGYVTFANNEQIADSATVTMSSGVFNGTGVTTNHRNGHVETLGYLLVTGGVFNTGDSNWTITESGSFTGGAGNTMFIGNSGSQVFFGALTVTGMTATAGGTVGTPNSFTVYGNSTTRRSTLRVGSGGLTLNGSVLNLRRGGSGALGSRLVLDGNVTTTGSSASSIVEDTAGGTSGQIGVELSSTAGSVVRTFTIGGGGANLTISIPISNGAASSAGIIKTGPGTLTFSGAMANTYTGTTTVNQGQLYLAKASGVVAVSGDLVISGGYVTFAANEQIADSATVTMSGSSSVLNGTGPHAGYRMDHVETFQSLMATGGAFNTGGGSTWTISGPASFTGGSGNTVFVGHSGTIISVGSLSLTGMPVTAGNNVGAPNSFTLYGNSTARRSTLTVGSGGLTLNGSVLNLCQGDTAGALGSRLVLDGDLTTLGSSPSAIVRDAARGSIGQIGVELSSTAGSVVRTFTIGGGGADLTISIPISNGAASSAGILKAGPGTLTLSAANTYTGGTTITAGTLLVNNTTGSGTGTGLVDVQGGLLGGNGTVGGSVQVQSGGTVSAGNSPGHLSILGSYNQAGTLLVELAGYQQGGTQALPGQWMTNGYDWVSVGGSAVLDGYVQIDLLAGFRPATGDTFHVLTAAGGITDQGLELVWDAGSLLPAQYWTYRILGGQGSEQILQLQVGVPEPASLLLLVLGAAGLALVRGLLRRK